MLIDGWCVKTEQHDRYAIAWQFPITILVNKTTTANDISMTLFSKCAESVQKLPQKILKT